MKHSNLFFILFSLITHHHVIADEKNWIDLIPEIEPAQNTIAGNWYKNEEGLNVDASQNARLTLPFNTNSNYEIRTSFNTYQWNSFHRFIFYLQQSTGRF